MGHERVGVLPRTLRWRRVVEQIGAFSGSDEQISEVASSTLENVRTRFLRIHEDPGVQAAFKYLVALASPPDNLQSPAAGTLPRPPLDADPSPLRLAADLQQWVDGNRSSLEYAELARRAATDVIALWTKQQAKQIGLFGTESTAEEVWRPAQSAAGFCEVSRLFFAKFTERYLNYFLEREASAVLPTLRAREEFAEKLRSHVEAVSKHAFETSKITQSFAAGWYNNRVRRQAPSSGEVETFLNTAFGKVREELLRETYQ